MYAECFVVPYAALNVPGPPGPPGPPGTPGHSPGVGVTTDRNNWTSVHLVSGMHLYSISTTTAGYIVLVDAKEMAFD